MTLELFKNRGFSGPAEYNFAEGARVLRGAALSDEAELLSELKAVLKEAPFRHMVTPGGHRMSVAMSNCGGLGWVTDRRGYRYDELDPITKKAWPSMPKIFLQLAAETAAAAGYEGFVPDACLINRYAPGAKMSLHQDKNERDFSEPIVSVSLGIAAVFLFGGMERSDKTEAIPVQHGDVVVWGGDARLRYHGVRRLKDAEHPLVGRVRINLTFRKAG